MTKLTQLSESELLAELDRVREAIDQVLVCHEAAYRAFRLHGIDDDTLRSANAALRDLEAEEAALLSELGARDTRAREIWRAKHPSFRPITYPLVP